MQVFLLLRSLHYTVLTLREPTKIFKNYFSTTRFNVTRTSVLASLVGRSGQKTLCGVIDNLKRQFHENIDTAFFQGLAPHSFPF